MITSLAARMLPRDLGSRFARFEDHRKIRSLIAKVIPGYEEIGAIDESKNEFHVGGRVFRTPRFATANARAKFHAVAIPELTGEGMDELRLMTMRSEGQFNTVVYEEEDIYRGQERRDVILMNAADMKRMKLRPDQRVTVSSETGEMRGVLAREAAIREGNAARYYPEANVLVPRRVDGESRTPSFKNVVVRVKAERSLPVIASGPVIAGGPVTASREKHAKS